jgi:hypothetical protein
LIKNATEAQVQAIVIQEEWQMYRYQDSLRWSKIQTITGIEIALFAGIYSAPVAVSSNTKIAFAFLVSALVLCMCLLAEKDGRDADFHLARAERMIPLAEILNVPRPKAPLGLRGKNIMRVSMAIVTVLNLLLLLSIYD